MACIAEVEGRFNGPMSERLAAIDHLLCLFGSGADNELTCGVEIRGHAPLCTAGRD